MARKKNEKTTFSASDDPSLTGIVELNNGAPIICGEKDAKCCYTQEDARDSCAYTRSPDVSGELYGKKYGYSNLSVRPIAPGDPAYQPCNKGVQYRCYANTKAPCPTEKWDKSYNRDNPDGSHRPPFPIKVKSLGVFDCSENGPNATVLFPRGDGVFCAIKDWTQQPLEICCDPGKSYPRSLGCSPQTCFGRPACDQTSVVAQICSDKDNVAKDPGCIDTCLRSNDTNSVSWCNPKIKDYCQGKNLETEACRQYCSQDSLDKNRELAEFCDNSYVQYCQKTTDIDPERQRQLCGCINSKLPQANCVDSACTNQIAIKTKSLRENKGKCDGNICISQIYIDARTGKPIIDIDRVKFEQYCPGQPIPGSDPDNPYAPEKPKVPRNLELFVGVPVVLVLVVVALVLLFKK